MLDNSDGLARSAAILAEESKCRVVVSVGEGSCSAALRGYAERRGRPWRQYAIAGGEDYGLVFTAPAAGLGALKKALPGVHVVGRVVKGRGAQIENFNGKVEGFEHF